MSRQRLDKAQLRPAPRAPTSVIRLMCPGVSPDDLDHLEGLTTARNTRQPPSLDHHGLGIHRKLLCKIEGGVSPSRKRQLDLLIPSTTH